MSPSPASPLPLTRPAVVALLRAAGCVFAEDEAELIISTAAGPGEVAAMAGRRAAGLPLEHVLGWAEFCGLRISVGPGIFVPRRRTEFLVAQAAALARAATTTATAAGGGGRAAVVLDVCCGSGAIGAALAAALGRAEVHATDIDPGAAACAARNLAAAGGRVYQGDLYEPLPGALRGRVDVLVACAPYVPTEAIGLLPSEARVHEPLVALDGGADGLDVVRRVIAGASRWLSPGGHVLVETSDAQAPPAMRAAAACGLIPRLTVSEELNATVVIGTRPPAGHG
ncbi:putative protein N(5)-glutamine methyltransferase [Sphaerisporangium corydalis]|uniref:Methyltransferase domain-containing protein n=1 Tax=Sphaerisporangium corydalis TaxID=1441875 RepID=A0ABV9EES0_9ACTN|nr:putative protein N(5)-glutamine methyltransferase [Sphaerisporangium corydalis]